MPNFITNQPVSSFDMLAIGPVLLVVMAILGLRKLIHIIKRKPHSIDDER